MKRANGYVTDDGTFFERQEEAVLWEAEAVLRDAIPEGLNKEQVVNLIRALLPELRRYVDAHYAAYPTLRDQQTEDKDGAEALDGGAPEAAGHRGHLSSAEEDLASLLKLPARGPVNVPDMGSSPRTEKVQKRREEHGPRVRGADASSVRGGKDMATEQSAEPRHARSGRGQTHLQKREVE